MIVRKLIICYIYLLSCLGVHAIEFRLPEVPDSIRIPAYRADYVLAHFWDSIDGPINLSDDKMSIEQAFVDYLSVFPIANPSGQTIAVTTLFNKQILSEKDLVFFAELAEKYLYNTDSPMVSDSVYKIFLSTIIKSDRFSDVNKIRPQWQLEAIEKNNPGTIATDFPFTLPTQEKRNFRDYFPAKSPVLLIFYDPDCSHCRTIIEEIKNNANLSNAVESDKIKVIAIYSGEDFDMWQSTFDEMPDKWIVGYDDGSLQEDGLYVIRSLPSLYLIDVDGIIIQKETSPNLLPY